MLAALAGTVSDAAGATLAARSAASSADFRYAVVIMEFPFV